MFIYYYYYILLDLFCSALGDPQITVYFNTKRR